MKCREIVELMTDYLEGTLSPRDRARFEEHMTGCDGCNAYLEQLRATMNTVRRLADEPVPEPMRSALLDAFRDWKTAHA